MIDLLGRSPLARRLNQILDFLGVGSDDGDQTLHKVNAIAAPRIPTICTVVSALNIKLVLRTLLGTNLIDRLPPLYFGKAEKPTIDPGLRRESWAHYADDVARLEPRIGCRLDVWRQANGS